MIALLFLPLFLCALAASVSSHSMDGRLTRRTGQRTTASMTQLPPTGLRRLRRRGLSIDLNEAPTHSFDLNEMPDLNGEPAHHTEGESSSSHPFRNEHKTKKVEEVKVVLRLGPSVSSKQERRKKGELLGYKRKEKFRDEDRGKKLEEVEASHNNPQDTSVTRKTLGDARHREKKLLLGYKWHDRIRDEHKGWKLEDIKKSQGLDPSVPVPSVRAWKRRKDGRGIGIQ